MSDTWKNTGTHTIKQESGGSVSDTNVSAVRTHSSVISVSLTLHGGRGSVHSRAVTGPHRVVQLLLTLLRLLEYVSRMRLRDVEQFW